MKNSLLLLFSSLLLLGCNITAEEQKSRYGMQCVEGFLFAEHKGGYGTNFVQVFEAAKNPENPPQPKTCTDEINE